uniref:SIS domain-containing protein n=1 Tax=Thaumasiovibrio occultus TaxID=1891184 RepID=UPI000B34CD65|nr:SIS domain-containing protein [Thaumasiovibrio occultus]
MNTMMTYIEQQPAMFAELTSGKFDEAMLAAVEKVMPADKSKMQVVIVASGTSLNAARVAASRMECPVECFYPYDFTVYHDLSKYDENTLFIFISQGGSSLSTYNALQRVKGQYRTLALVGDLTKPIATEADAAIEFGCGVESVIYRTKGYTSSALMLCKVADILNGKPGATDYAKDVAAFGEFVAASKAFVEHHLAEMAPSSAWMVSGSGINNVTAVEGALKLIETVRVPAMSFDLEEFIHGAQNSIVDTTRIVVVENFDDAEDKAYNLFRALRKIGKEAYLIGVKPRSEFNNYVLVRPESAFDELMAVVPMQYMSYFVSQEKGVDLTKSGLPELSEHLAKSL